MHRGDKGEIEEVQEAPKKDQIPATEKNVSSFFNNYSDYQLGNFLLNSITHIAGNEYFPLGGLSGVQKDSKIGIYNESAVKQLVVELLNTAKHSNDNVFIVFRGVNWNVGIVYKPKKDENEQDQVIIFDATNFENTIKKRAKNNEILKSELNDANMQTELKALLAADLNKKKSKSKIKEKASTIGILQFPHKDPMKEIKYIAGRLANEIMQASNFPRETADYQFAFETQIFSNDVSLFKELNNTKFFKDTSDSDKVTGQGVTINHLKAMSEGKVDFSHHDWNKKDKFGYTPLDVAIEQKKIVPQELINQALEQSKPVPILVDLIVKAKDDQYFKTHALNRCRTLLNENKLPVKSMLENAAKRGTPEILDFLAELNIFSHDKLAKKSELTDREKSAAQKESTFNPEAIAAIALQHGHADFFINLATKIGMGQFNPAQGLEKKTLYDHANKIKNSKKRVEVVKILNQNLLDKLDKGTISDDEYKELGKDKKHKTELFELIKNNKALLGKSLDHQKQSKCKLFEFFSVQRIITSGTSIEKGTLKKIYLQKLLLDLRDGAIDEQKIKDNYKHRKEIFNLIENDLSLLTDANQTGTTLNKFFTLKKEGLFEKSLPRAIDKAYKKLRAKHDKELKRPIKVVHKN